MSHRVRIQIAGVVQGVGFRPFVFRLAADVGLTGWVNNNPRGVTIEAEGSPDQLDDFLIRLRTEKPALSVIQSMEVSHLDPVGYECFEVRPSDEGGARSAWILPDIATCPDCLREILDPKDRRYRYPFTNCTNCGPRFSIIRSLPYDRGNTTMSLFKMCPSCQAEYDDPSDRRFHAQPNACPACGPKLALWDRGGESLATGEASLRGALDLIREGQVLALKGLGGFHLLCDARSDGAVRLLRKRKEREEKPFAVMFPSLDSVRESCKVSSLEGSLLLSAASPIVLLQKNGHGAVSTDVAPGNPCLGAMLPYTPLHHLLLSDLGFPVVATSGNLSDEPICTDEAQAVERLGALVDGFLLHDRPIARHVDDSVVRIMAGREMLMRRARGYAPMPVSIDAEMPPVVAVGAHLKNTLAFTRGSDVFISQHIGDLENSEAMNGFDGVLIDFPRLYGISPVAVVTDLHPDYAATRRGREVGVPIIEIQHHFAHVRSCMAENDLRGEVLGVAWDGVGLGDDRTLWGGEFLVADEISYRRVGHFRGFPLPGGDKAAREPRRSALGLLHELYGEKLFGKKSLESLKAFSPKELEILKVALNRKLNSPLTSSVGRLFDAVASITGLAQISRFEGQGAMNLEFAIGETEPVRRYVFETTKRAGEITVVDWEGPIRSILGDLHEGVSIGEIAAMFHNGLVEVIVGMARRSGIPRVVLSGGCFQNRFLTERSVIRLRQEGFQPYWHQRVPTNDGGISLGQAAAGAEIVRRG